MTNLHERIIVEDGDSQTFQQYGDLGTQTQFHLLPRQVSNTIPQPPSLSQQKEMIFEHILNTYQLSKTTKERWEKQKNGRQKNWVKVQYQEVTIKVKITDLEINILQSAMPKYFKYIGEVLLVQHLSENNPYTFILQPQKNNSEYTIDIEITKLKDRNISEYINYLTQLLGYQSVEDFLNSDIHFKKKLSFTILTYVYEMINKSDLTDEERKELGLAPPSVIKDDDDMNEIRKKYYTTQIRKDDDGYERVNKYKVNTYNKLKESINEIKKSFTEEFEGSDINILHIYDELKKKIGTKLYKIYSNEEIEKETRWLLDVNSEFFEYINQSAIEYIKENMTLEEFELYGDEIIQSNEFEEFRIYIEMSVELDYLKEYAKALSQNVKTYEDWTLDKFDPFNDEIILSITLNENHINDIIKYYSEDIENMIKNKDTDEEILEYLLKQVQEDLEEDISLSKGYRFMEYNANFDTFSKEYKILKQRLDNKITEIKNKK